ncbi:MAG TPA: BON domain-containing protein [Burkholderiales bacterium]|jgi:hypothetical protein|nr:BON domain-containing protein [Burkholderiales bacterium]
MAFFSPATVPRARFGALAGTLALMLGACGQSPAMNVAPIKHADLRQTPLEPTRAPTAGPGSVGTLVAQARAPEAPATPAKPGDAAPAIPQAAPGAGRPSTASRAVSDAELAARVKAAVLAQPLSALMFDVKVSKGVVTLSGTADTPATRDKAIRAASDVEGVKSVNNRINVLSGS